VTFSGKVTDCNLCNNLSLDPPIPMCVWETQMATKNVNIPLYSQCLVCLFWVTAHGGATSSAADFTDEELS